MNPSQIMAELPRIGGTLEADAGKLRCIAPTGEVGADLIEAIRANRLDLVELLRAVERSKVQGVIPKVKTGLSTELTAEIPDSYDAEGRKVESIDAIYTHTRSHTGTGTGTGTGTHADARAHTHMKRPEFEILSTFRPASPQTQASQMVDTAESAKILSANVAGLSTFRPASPGNGVQDDSRPGDFTALDCPAFAFDDTLSVSVADVRRTVAECSHLDNPPISRPS
jgi:hypothetical protein